MTQYENDVISVATGIRDFFIDNNQSILDEIDFAMVAILGVMFVFFVIILCVVCSINKKAKEQRNNIAHIMELVEGQAKEREKELISTEEKKETENE